jgi:anthranilate synthase component I
MHCAARLGQAGAPVAMRCAPAPLRRLRPGRARPRSCSACVQTRRCILVAASPEILCRIDSARTITNRPLAGTRPRGATAAADAALEADLLADEKERAEHIMLVDLGRNDVGKVAEAGSVRVERFMDVERYSHVMHISSSVTGARVLAAC